MKKTAVFFSLLFLTACLGFGLARLFAIRFAQGDVYAAYSTLRADGIGSKALHDSLAELMPVERNYKQLSGLHPEGGRSAVFLLGAVYYELEDEDDAAGLEALARDGNRVVMAFLPYRYKPYEPSPTPEKTPADQSKKSADKKSGDKEAADLGKRLGVKTAFSPSLPDHAKTGIAGLEPELSWHSTMYFSGLDPAWRTLYSCGGKPVVIERAFGSGSIVLMTDSYFSSNEALSKERAPGFISALVGGAGTVIFDETHLGGSEHPGVASLVRKYRLHGVVLALICVAALFIWRNAFALVPPDEEALARQDAVMGSGAAAGFVSLLKRNIPFNKLMETCLAEWKRSFGHRTKPATLARVEELAAAGAKQPVQTFQTIMQILNEKK